MYLKMMMSQNNVHTGQEKKATSVQSSCLHNLTSLKHEQKPHGFLKVDLKTTKRYNVVRDDPAVAIEDLNSIRISFGLIIQTHTM